MRMDEFLQLVIYHTILFTQYTKYLHLLILDLLIRFHDSIGKSQVVFIPVMMMKSPSHNPRIVFSNDVLQVQHARWLHAVKLAIFVFMSEAYINCINFIVLHHTNNGSKSNEFSELDEFNHYWYFDHGGGNIIIGN